MRYIFIMSLMFSMNSLGMQEAVNYRPLGQQEYFDVQLGQFVIPPLPPGLHVDKVKEIPVAGEASEISPYASEAPLNDSSEEEEPADERPEDEYMNLMMDAFRDPR